MENKIDIVAEYIELKKKYKEIDEKLSALETLIFAEHRNDDRIKITAGRKSYTLTDECYEALEVAGLEVEVVETRKKKLDEFDIGVQKSILENPKNYVEKITKESIRLK
jgi:hypothetical protein